MARFIRIFLFYQNFIFFGKIRIHPQTPCYCPGCSQSDPTRPVTHLNGIPDIIGGQNISYFRKTAQGEPGKTVSLNNPIYATPLLRSADSRAESALFRLFPFSGRKTVPYPDDHMHIPEVRWNNSDNRLCGFPYSSCPL